MRHIVGPHGLVLGQSHRLDVHVLLGDATLAPLTTASCVGRGRVVLEHFLSVGPDLRAYPCAHMLSHLLPVLPVDPNRCSQDKCWLDLGAKSYVAP